MLLFAARIGETNRIRNISASGVSLGVSLITDSSTLISKFGMWEDVFNLLYNIHHVYNCILGYNGSCRTAFKGTSDAVSPQKPPSPATR